MSRRLNPYQWVSEDVNGRAGVSAEQRETGPGLRQDSQLMI